jgi:hypothetical protein
MPGLYAAAGLNGLGLVLGLVAALAEGALVADAPSPAPLPRIFAQPGPGSLRDAPEILASVRIDSVSLRRGTVEAVETIAVLEEGGFAALHVPLLRRDPAASLDEPGTIVLTRRLALKYFGSIDCLGRTLEIDATAARVTAVAEDMLPATVGGFVLR